MKLKFQESLVELTKTERSLLSMFLFYPEVLKNASEKLSPAEIANYTYELAKTFNHFYHESSILNEANENSKNFRLQLSWFVSNMIKKNMALLGIEVPEKM